MASSSNTVKIVVVGDGSVGKTTLCTVYRTKVYPDDYTPTIFENHCETLYVNGEVINAQWNVISQFLAPTSLIQFVLKPKYSCKYFKAKCRHEKYVIKIVELVTLFLTISSVKFHHSTLCPRKKSEGQGQIISPLSAIYFA